MTVFVALSALLVAVALLLVLPPLLGRSAQRRVSSDRRAQAEVAIAVLREQVADLNAERSAGRIDEAAYARTHAELEQRALEEGLAVEDGADQRPSRVWAIALVLIVPLLGMVIYGAIGEPDALDPAARVAEQQPQQQFSQEEIAGMVAQLAERLENDPSDATGWAMLARSYSMLGQFEEARATWSRIGANVPNDAMIIADWADLLVAAQEGDFEGEPRRLIERALELEPDNFKALALGGAAAFERGDFADASARWERILAQVPREDPAWTSVAASINEARARGGMPLLDVPVPPPSAALTISGGVRLASDLQVDLPPAATVFIFVRAPEGGVPFAAVRLPASALPARFDFSAAQRMNDAPLPPEVLVAARVSMTGDAAPQPGDLEAMALRVRPDAGGLELIIDRVRD